MFNEKQIQEIEAHGLTVAQVEAQIEAFKRGFPSLEVVKAASPEDGITCLSEAECEAAVENYNKAVVFLHLLERPLGIRE